jgi:hypothetical protein
MRVSFEKRADGNWDATSYPVPQELCDRAHLNGGREVQLLLRQAGEIYISHLAALKH